MEKITSLKFVKFLKKLKGFLEKNVFASFAKEKTPADGQNLPAEMLQKESLN